MTKSATVTFSAVGQGVKAVVDGVGPDGSKTHREYTANFDGKPYPVTGNGLGDMVVTRCQSDDDREFVYVEREADRREHADSVG